MKKIKHTYLWATLLVFATLLTGCSTDSAKATTSSSSSTVTSTKASSSQKIETTTSTSEKTATSTLEETTTSSLSSNEATSEIASETTNQELAELTFQGTQTIEINHNQPTFSKADLSLANGAWEKYGDLDNLNRATQANAMLNQSLMPTEKRGDISSVTPTGWKNKKIASGYLYNRSHLIGYALAGENANWKNLITGTRQLNSPEMLRFEMDIKAYLEESKDHFVRYQVTPIFLKDELLARGVHLMAQSIGDNRISFNVYIFNVQDGVTINYADGSSVVNEKTTSPSSQAVENTPSANSSTVSKEPTNSATVYITPTGKKYHTHPHGNGSFSPTTLDNAKAQGLTPCKTCYK